MKPPAVLLFDLGGVLVENVGFERLDALLPAPMEREALKTRWLQSAAVRAFEVGSCSPSDFASAMVDEWRLSISPDAFLDDFASWPKGLYPGARDLLARLRTRHTLACLSNSNAVHWQRFGGFREHFRFSLSSHLLRRAKPDVACFLLACEACAADPATVAFFDDSLDNVVAARDLGLQAFHVDGPQEVERALATAGWLSAASRSGAD